MGESIPECFPRHLLNNIRHGRNSQAYSMLHKSPNLLKASDNTGTLLHYAAQYNNERITDHLIGKGLEIDSQNVNGQTPLMLAVKRGSLKTVEELLRANVNIDITDSDGNTALKLLFTSKHLNDDLLDAFAERFQRDGISIEELVNKLFEAGCPMSCAMRMHVLQRIEVMSGLLQRGVHIDSTDPRGCTALLFAIKYNCNEYLAEWLMDNGANVNVADKEFSYCLHNAVHNDNVKMVRLLLEHGADVNVEDKYGLTPLYYLIIHVSLDLNGMERDRECIELCFEYEALITPFESDDGTRIFDLIFCPEFRDRPYLFVSHLAVLEKRGFAIPEDALSCNDENNFSKVPRLEKYYRNCKHVLDSIVYESESLIVLLSKKESQMRDNVRNEQFILATRRIANQLHKNYPWYAKLLTKKVSKASELVKLEDAAIPIFCKLIGYSYGQCYDFARGMVSYLSKRDLERLCQV